MYVYICMCIYIYIYIYIIDLFAVSYLTLDDIISLLHTQYIHFYLSHGRRTV